MHYCVTILKQSLYGIALYWKFNQPFMKTAKDSWRRFDNFEDIERLMFLIHKHEARV